jgi:hypothetical protein
VVLLGSPLVDIASLGVVATCPLWGTAFLWVVGFLSLCFFRFLTVFFVRSRPSLVVALLGSPLLGASLGVVVPCPLNGAVLFLPGVSSMFDN